MYRVNKDGETVLDRTRSYHNADRTERDCRTEHSQSYTFDARWALLYAARLVGATELRCVDCDARCSDLTNLYAGDGCVSWEADHELPLEDGGEHVIENLRCRCVPCHSAKTAHENVTRRRGRERAASPQLALGAT
jgi:5-methylcytosine-specific restriction endonuclease McrA